MSVLRLSKVLEIFAWMHCMTDVATETAFRLDPRKHFQKSKHLLRSEVNWCDQTSIELHLRRSTSAGESHWWVDRSTCLASRVRISTEKESFPGSEFKPASIWTCWMLIDRQICSQRSCRNFTGGFRSWPPATCTTRTSFDHHGKRSGILYKKWVLKMKKSRISHWSESDENAKWLRDCLWLCQACKRGFTCRPM